MCVCVCVCVCVHNMPARIAQGRVNKEYYQSQVLLEQPFYVDSKKKINEYAKESGVEIMGYSYFAVGAFPAAD